MAAAIDERNLLSGVQTGEAPGCILDDLRSLVQETAIMGVGTGFKSLHDSAVLTLMWRTFGRAIYTCFARKSHLSLPASGELFSHLARIKTSVAQGISIYKSAVRWEQCMFHALGMLFVGASEPSSFIFPMMPHAATSDLPGEKTHSQDEAIIFRENLHNEKEEVPVVKRVRGRPNVSKYIDDVITEMTKLCAPLPPDMTAGLTSHSLELRKPMRVLNWLFNGHLPEMHGCSTRCWHYNPGGPERRKGTGWLQRPLSSLCNTVDPDLKGARDCARIRAPTVVSRPALQERQQLPPSFTQ